MSSNLWSQLCLCCQPSVKNSNHIVNECKNKQVINEFQKTENPLNYVVLETEKNACVLFNHETYTSNEREGRFTGYHYGSSTRWNRMGTIGKCNLRIVIYLKGDIKLVVQWPLLAQRWFLRQKHQGLVKKIAFVCSNVFKKQKKAKKRKKSTTKGLRQYKVEIMTRQFYNRNEYEIYSISIAPL